MAMAGRLGLAIDLTAIPASTPLSPHELLFSESAGRFVIATSPGNSQALEKKLEGFQAARVGAVIPEPTLRLSGLADIRIDDLLEKYKSTLHEV